MAGDRSGVVKGNVAWHPKPDTCQCCSFTPGGGLGRSWSLRGSTAVISVEVRRCLSTSTEQCGAPH